VKKSIELECERIRDLLIEKNEAYGDSAANPVRLFSQCDAIEALNVRIDDKLSRLARGKGDDTEDTELDLIGYLILRRIVRRIKKIEESRKNTVPIGLSDAYVGRGEFHNPARLESPGHGYEFARVGMTRDLCSHWWNQYKKEWVVMDELKGELMPGTTYRVKIS